MLTSENQLDRSVLKLLQESDRPLQPEQVIRKICREQDIEEKLIAEALSRLLNLKLISLTSDLRLSAK